MFAVVLRDRCRRYRRCLLAILAVRHQNARAEHKNSADDSQRSDVRSHERGVADEEPHDDEVVEAVAEDRRDVAKALRRNEVSVALQTYAVEACSPWRVPCNRTTD